MKAKKVDYAAEYLCSLPHDCDAVDELREFAGRMGIKSAVFSAIGAAKSARLAYYDQKEHRYLEFDLNEPMEIVQCFGNISMKDGQHAVHAHVSLARKDGSTVGGHLVSCRIFAGELYLRAFKGGMSRAMDGVTGLNLMEYGQVPEEDLQEVAENQSSRKA